MTTKFLSAFIFVICFITAAENVYSDEKIYFDIKTPLFEKADLSPAHIGTTIALMQSDWAGVREFGEDYSLWLRNYEKVKRGNTFIISLDVELRTPSLFRRGGLIRKRRITVRMHEEESWQETDSITSNIGQRMKNASENLKTEAMLIGQEVEKALIRMLRPAVFH